MDENLILDELSHKKVSTWKRLAIFFMETILIIGTSLGLFFSVGSLAISGIANNSIATINEIYAEECEKSDLPYKESTYGLYELDKASYIAKIESYYSSYEEAMEKYNNKYYEIDTAIQSYPGYSKAYANFAATYYVTLLVSVFIPCFIYLFLIPVLSKGNKTISMHLTKTSLVIDNSNVVCGNGRIIARFFTVYAIEFALGYVVGQLLGIGFVIIINIITISFSKKKKALHDFFTQCHVEKDEYTYTE